MNKHSSVPVFMRHSSPRDDKHGSPGYICVCAQAGRPSQLGRVGSVPATPPGANIPGEGVETANQSGNKRAI